MSCRSNCSTREVAEFGLTSWGQPILYINVLNFIMMASGLLPARVIILISKELEGVTLMAYCITWPHFHFCHFFPLYSF
jgi:hypothetical protein